MNYNNHQLNNNESKINIYTQAILACMLVLGVNKSMATVTVTLTIDETADRPAALDVAANNLGLLLTEINRRPTSKKYLDHKRTTYG